MISNKTITIILIIFVLGILVYFYLQQNKTKNHEFLKESLNDKKIKSRTKSKSRSKSKSKSKKINSKNIKPKNTNPKKVRFNDCVEYKTYKNMSPSIDSSKIDVDTILSCGFLNSPIKTSPKLISPSLNLSCSDSEKSESLRSNSSVCSSDDDSDSSESDCHINYDNVIPSNLKSETDNWDNNFGLPLMSQKEHNNFVSKLKKNHSNYEKSIGEFTKYKTDNSTLIKTDTTIDPFAPKNKPSLSGLAVCDVYDQKVAGPKARPKIVKKNSPTCVIYENENEMNGGQISGTELTGFDGSAGYKSAAFGCEF
ncbi:hypothetical protein QLL95_gp0844 [Cotonvirus japonicus]|uniref:Secreted protein n=1 Tax=Cotonvirus japonicus TaxID=2811091 RepID=A0ABM7NT12_9VIRU|nr:hypothetical protein QLL95_gp0844 [Cotonvirus japonicus]BCS83279.1 hypothetical protein [Cotonvirus japonicus]